ncbi:MULTISPECIES: phage protein Gp36 family protein [unclassified Sphingobium]|uniref:phage protein Gp36 family protein n=1 Tax=unclassified Sphingobium TaxID=2611147 RepID=UPI0035A63A12
MFATAEDMRARFTDLVELTDQAEWNAQAIAAVDMKLRLATSIAEGYVAKYHDPAPCRAIPPLLTDIVCDIAYARLHRSPSDSVKDREAAAMRLLRDISNGLVKIDQGKQDIPARSGALIVPDVPRTFSRDTLGGF